VPRDSREAGGPSRTSGNTRIRGCSRRRSTGRAAGSPWARSEAGARSRGTDRSPLPWGIPRFRGGNPFKNVAPPVSELHTSPPEQDATARTCPRAAGSHEAFLRHGLLGAGDGPLSGGGEAPPPQDDLHELLRAERDARDAVPEVPEQGAAPEGEGSAEGVGDPGQYRGPRRSRVATRETEEPGSRTS